VFFHTYWISDDKKVINKDLKRVKNLKIVIPKPFQDQKLMGSISQKSMLLRLLHILAHTGFEILLGYS
jgi:hypothetical protein